MYLDRARSHPITSRTSANAVVAQAARRSVAPGLDVAAVMAGFIRWLAQRQLPPGHRRRYHLAAERFLSWRSGQRHWRAGQHHGVEVHGLESHDLESCQRRYLAVLREAGHGGAELAVVDTGIEQLRSYLATGHDPDTSPCYPVEMVGIDPAQASTGTRLAYRAGLPDSPNHSPARDREQRPWARSTPRQPESADAGC